MSGTIIPRNELIFLLFDWLEGETLLSQTRFAAIDRATVEAVLDLSQQLAEEAFLPGYKAGDQEEPQLAGDGVKTSASIRNAVEQYREAGLFGIGFPEAEGGAGLPSLFSAASFAQFAAANLAASAFPMLTGANARLLLHFGSRSQVEQFAHPQIAGRYFGTMCLSEPQAGSSLGDIDTIAVPDGEDGLGERYRLTGRKMWISGGDQDISENIVHLVLARTGDRADAGDTRALSLFIVPKILPDGARNDVAVAGLNHKMGYRGIPNCLLNLGETDGAMGWLVGRAGDGLRQMFQMMNEARTSVGLGAAAAACRSCRLAVRYAQERSQGRSAQDGRGRSLPIIRHPDVREMLLAQRCYAEGALALCLYSALLNDREDSRSQALLGILTPITKTWPSEFGLVANDLAIQVHGGYGYTRDFDVEQLYRDNRLNPIHEGTTGIQALDLVGRKLRRDGGASYRVLRETVDRTVGIASAVPELAAHAERLEATWRMIDDAVELAVSGDEQLVLSHATALLRAIGHGVTGFVWLDQVTAALKHARSLPPGFVAGKVACCTYFVERELPKVAALLAPVSSGSCLTLDLPDSIFED